MRGRTRRVVDVIPAERLEWTWQEGKFTLGDLVRHLAGIERYMYAENARRRPSLYPGHGRELADGLEAVRAYLGILGVPTPPIYGLTSEEVRERSRPQAAAEPKA